MSAAPYLRDWKSRSGGVLKRKETGCPQELLVVNAKSACDPAMVPLQIIFIRGETSRHLRFHRT